MRDRTKFLILGIIIASFLCIGVVGCAALFGESARTDIKYRPVEMTSGTAVQPNGDIVTVTKMESPDAILWAAPMATPPVIVPVNLPSGTMVLDGPSPISSGSLGLKEKEKIEVPAKPGLIQGAQTILTATGASETPWGGIATLAIGLAVAIGGMVKGKRDATRARVEDAKAFVAYEKTPATTTGPGSAMETIAEVAPKLLALYQQMQKK